MSTMHGADVAELRRLAAEFRTAADDLDRDGGQLTRLLNGVDWIGGVASRFTNQWTGVQLPRINLSTRFLREAADELSRNADQQERASRMASGSAAGTGWSEPGGSGWARVNQGLDGRRADVMPAPPIPLNERSSSTLDKKGAIARGVDGSVIELIEMSDGTFRVVVTLQNGMTVDVGDAVTLAQWAKGNFFAEGGAEWDFDASWMTSGSTDYTFSDGASAEQFYAALVAKQQALINRVGLMGWDDVIGVVNDIGGDLQGDIEWSGHRGAQTFSAEGSFGIRMGEGGTGASAELSGAIGLATETKASDGSTGQLFAIGGHVSVTGTVEVGDLQIEGSGLAGYERQVHLVRDAAGNPLRLEVSEQYLASATGTEGFKFLGTGSQAGVTSMGRIDSQLVFDLSDPAVAGRFDVGASADDLYGWAKDNSELGGHTVATYSGTSVSSSSSILLSGEWNSEGSSSTLTGSTYRPPGGDGYGNYVPDMRSPADGMVRQIVTEADGTRTVVDTGTF